MPEFSVAPSRETRSSSQRVASQRVCKICSFCGFTGHADSVCPRLLQHRLFHARRSPAESSSARARSPESRPQQHKSRSRSRSRSRSPEAEPTRKLRAREVQLPAQDGEAKHTTQHLPMCCICGASYNHRRGSMRFLDFREFTIPAGSTVAYPQGKLRCGACRHERCQPMPARDSRPATTHVAVPSPVVG
jgi:hypothetical protein